MLTNLIISAMIMVLHLERKWTEEKHISKMYSWAYVLAIVLFNAAH